MLWKRKRWVLSSLGPFRKASTCKAPAARRNAYIIMHHVGSLMTHPADVNKQSRWLMDPRRLVIKATRATLSFAHRLSLCFCYFSSGKIRHVAQAFRHSSIWCCNYHGNRPARCGPARCPPAAPSADSLAQTRPSLPPYSRTTSEARPQRLPALGRLPPPDWPLMAQFDFVLI